MTVPTVHLNGTSREELSRQLENADRAICAALGALHDAAPNARDYYPQGPDVYRQAEREHRARIDKLVDVRNDIAVLYESVAGDQR